MSWVRTQCRHGPGSSPFAHRPVRPARCTWPGATDTWFGPEPATGIASGRLHSTVSPFGRRRTPRPYVRVRPACDSTSVVAWGGPTVINGHLAPRGGQRRERLRRRALREMTASVPRGAEERTWAGSSATRDCGGQVAAFPGCFDPVLDGGLWPVEQAGQAPGKHRSVDGFAEICVGHPVQEAFVELRSFSLRRCGEEVCVLQCLHGSGRQVWSRRPGSPEDGSGQAHAGFHVPASG